MGATGASHCGAKPMTFRPRVQCSSHKTTQLIGQNRAEMEDGAFDPLSATRPQARPADQEGVALPLLPLGGKGTRTEVFGRATSRAPRNGPSLRVPVNGALLPLFTGRAPSEFTQDPSGPTDELGNINLRSLTDGRPRSSRGAQTRAPSRGARRHHCLRTGTRNATTPSPE
ncbi:hypothetical protein SKAU_G00316890 [Synaphobranchus kaupii]|uniref:Uncharacterized protein n=1 Tax=Synaphobranchus kaupii TaxID=118154 RepID=A0A9Q1ESS4_SYNKA|nr:hypothetical protein SKAU_G00316890 [Synaphobranchus kaupii]